MPKFAHLNSRNGVIYCSWGDISAKLLPFAGCYDYLFIDRYCGKQNDFIRKYSQHSHANARLLFGCRQMRQRSAKKVKITQWIRNVYFRCVHNYTPSNRCERGAWTVKCVCNDAIIWIVFLGFRICVFHLIPRFPYRRESPRPIMSQYAQETLVFHFRRVTFSVKGRSHAIAQLCQVQKF